MTSKITEYLKLAEKATPGPWHIGHVSEVSDQADIDSPNGLTIALVGERADQSFVIASRTMGPALAKALISFKAMANEYKIRAYEDGAIDAAEWIENLIDEASADIEKILGEAK